MRVFIGTANGIKRLVTALCAVAVGGLLLAFPQAAANGVTRGLAVCTEQLIPSLFPFLVLSGFLIKSGIAADVGRRVAPLMRPLGLSGVAATALTLSVLGGYPSGANAVAGLLEQELIDRDEGENLMRVCVHAGPAFVLGGVGVGMLGSWQAGALLLAAHWLSSLLILLCLRSRSSASAPRQAVTYPPLATAVTASVHDAARSLVGMCGFVLLASCALSLTDALGAGHTAHSVWRCALACLTEVTNGCVEAASMGAAAPFWLGAALGFGGLSVHGQIAARTAPFRLLSPAFFAARLWHALLGGWISQLLFWWVRPPMPAVPSGAALSSLTSDNPVVASSGLVAMVLMCVLLLYTIPLQKPNVTP